MEQSTPLANADEQATQAPTIIPMCSPEHSSNLPEVASPSTRSSEPHTDPNANAVGEENTDTDNSSNASTFFGMRRSKPPWQSSPAWSAAWANGFGIKEALTGQGVVRYVTHKVTVHRVVSAVTFGLAELDYDGLFIRAMARLVARMFSTQALVDLRRWHNTIYSHRLLDSAIQNLDNSSEILGTKIVQFENMTAAVAQLVSVQRSETDSYGTIPNWMRTRLELWQKYHLLKRRVRGDKQALEQITEASKIYDSDYSDEERENPNPHMSFENDTLNFLCSGLLPMFSDAVTVGKVQRTLTSDLRIGASLKFISSTGGMGLLYMLHDNSIQDILGLVPPEIVASGMGIVRDIIPKLKDIFEPLVEYINRDELRSSLRFHSSSDHWLLGITPKMESQSMQYLLLPHGSNYPPDFATGQGEGSPQQDDLDNVHLKPVENVAAKGTLSATTTTTSQGRAQLVGGPGLNDSDLDFDSGDDGSRVDDASGLEEHSSNENPVAD